MMSFNRTYTHAYAIYRIERIIRNVCVLGAMYNAVGHHVNLISAFFLAGLMAQLHPILLTYVHHIHHKHPQFGQYLARQINNLNTKNEQLVVTEQDEHISNDPSMHVSRDSQIYHNYQEIQFIKLIQK